MTGVLKPEKIFVKMYQIFQRIRNNNGIVYYFELLEMLAITFLSQHHTPSTATALFAEYFGSGNVHRIVFETVSHNVTDVSV